MAQHDRPRGHHRGGRHHQEGQRPGRRPPVERRAGQGGAVLGDDHDPGDAPAGQGADQPAHQVRDQADHAAQQPQDRGRTHDGRDDQVGGDGHQADLAGDPGDERRARQLGRRRHRDRLGQPPRQPARQGVPPRRRDQQDACGREHREREPRRARQSGLDEQQPDHRCAEAADAPVPAAPAQPDQRHGAHGGGAQHAGLGAGQQHEADDPGHADDAEPAAPDPHPASHHQQEPDHEGEVRARDGRQVRQAGGAEVLDQSRRHPGVVAVDQRRHQRLLAGGPVGHRVADRGPQGLGGPPGRSRGSRRLGRPARSHRGGQVARVLDGRQPAGEADPFPDGDPLPGVVAEHQDGLVPTHGDPHQHPVAEATLDPPRVAGHRARQGHAGRAAGRPSRPAPRAPPRTGPAPPPRPRRRRPASPAR